jgi:hypothetical protein
MSCATQLVFDSLLEETQTSLDMNFWLKENPYGWLHRCLHATAEAALKEARIASPLIGRIYVVESKVPADFRQYWPHDTHWYNSTQKPFWGKSGIYYTPKPNHYIVQSGTEYFEPGEVK